MEKSDIRTFVLMGKPGSGKSIQSQLLQERLGYKRFATGERFRELASAPTALGERIRSVINKGDLMPYWFASFLFQEAVMHLSIEEGIVFESSARTLDEAKLLHDVLKFLGRPYVAIDLVVDDEVVIERLSNRAEGRADDSSEEIMRNRLKRYTENTAPAIDYFRQQDTLIEVDGEEPVEKVHDEIIEKLRAYDCTH